MTLPPESAFSMRRLNPFNGMLQVFLHGSARALSGNGLVWEIQVLSDTPQGLWANTPFSERQYYSFGLWSAAHGLKQVPVNPLFNIRHMIEASEHLIEALRPALDRLPFAPADALECWLLDETTGRPVALLASRRDTDVATTRERIRWLAAERGDFAFVSPSLLERGLPVNDGYNPRVHASVLEALVRGRGGQHLRQAWYRRQADGGGAPCDDDREQPLAAADFPELTLTADWAQPEDRALVGDYIAWKAPQLLMLPALDSATRDRLEQLAVAQPEAVDRLWRLYPQIHNQDRLNQARVEARIRQSHRK
ncbi:MAG: hypothetical protein P8178_12200 [Candidatus Thiodiazotropha sp.]